MKTKNKTSKTQYAQYIGEDYSHPIDEKKPQAKHTPGPWKIGGSIVSSADNTIARILRLPLMTKGQRWESADTDQEAPGDFFEVEANARLIAAAPELLRAAKAADALFQGLDDRGLLKLDGAKEWALVRATIAKAEGE